MVGVTGSIPVAPTIQKRSKINALDDVPASSPKYEPIRNDTGTRTFGTGETREICSRFVSGVEVRA
jgi:hypothetical protein